MRLQQSFEIPLQAATIHIGTDAFNVLNGQFAVLEQVAKSFTLTLIQTVFLHQFEGASTWRTNETIPVGFGTIQMVPAWRFRLEMEPRTSNNLSRHITPRIHPSI